MLAAKNADGRVKYIKLLIKIEIKLNFIYIIIVKKKGTKVIVGKKHLKKGLCPLLKRRNLKTSKKFPII